MKTFKELEVCPFPSAGMQIFNPKFRDMNLIQVKEVANLETEWVPYGYDYGLFLRSTATIHLYREIQFSK